MEDIQQSPQLSQPDDMEGSGLSSHTAVNNNATGGPPDCQRPINPEEPTTPYYNDNNNLHLLISSLHTTVNALAQTVSNQRTEISNLTAALATQSQRIDEFQLLESNRLSRRVRNEMLDTFALRGLLYWEDFEALGRETRHHYGDAVEDALLYIRGYRRDRSVWGRLYSLTPERVMGCYRAHDEATISVLDKRATLLLTRGLDDAALSDIEGAYLRFLHLLENGWGEQPEEDMQSPLTRAYHTFWEVCRVSGF